MSLNTSRTRRRKDSLGINGRNSSSDENSPQHRRKLNNVKNTPTNEVNKKKDESQKPKTSVGGKKEPVSNGMNHKRSGSFVLDINAIMGSLNVTSDSGEEEDDEDMEEELPAISLKSRGFKASQEVKQNGTSRRQNGVSSPTPVQKLDPPPAARNKTKSFDRKDTSQPVVENVTKDTSLPMSAAKPPPSPRRMAAKSGPRTQTSIQDNVEKGYSQKKGLSSEPEVEDRKSTASPTSGVVYRRKGFRKDEDDEREEEVLQSRSRVRANAVGAAARKATEERKEETNRKSDQFDDSKPLDSKYRSRAASSKEDGKVKRSGSFSKLNRQMSGDKALGIFYHNRRSQLTDHDSPEDSEKRSLLGDALERSGSFSSPQTPVAQRSTRTTAYDTSPLSPLLKTTSNTDIRNSVGISSGGGGADVNASSGPGNSPKLPLSPRMAAIPDDDDESEVIF